MDLTEAACADGDRLTADAQSSTVAAGLDDVDIRRIWQVVDLVRSHTARKLLAQILPGHAPAHVAAALTRHCRFAHGSVMVFTAGSPTATGQLPAELTPGPPTPSTVVRARVARRYGLPESDLQIQIVHAAMPASSAGDADDIEIFLCAAGPGDPYQRLLDDERRFNRETHFAFKVVVPEQRLLMRLWDLLTGPGQMIPDGGGFNPHEGLIGCTVLYFQTGGQLLPQGLPRRLELLIDGHHQILAAHLRATHAGHTGGDLRSEVVAHPAHDANSHRPPRPATRNRHGG